MTHLCANNGSVTVTKLLSAIFLLVSGYAPVSAQPADLDAVLRGERVYEHCVGCHTIEEGGPHLTGPNLFRIFGRDIANAEGYAYSDQLSAMDGVWDQNRLNRYIARPKLAVPGNSMPFLGLTSPHLRADLIAWLKSSPTKFTSTRPNASAIRGSQLAAACVTCHTFGKGEANSIGPNLWGVVGRPVAGVDTFNYSERLMRRSGTWSPTSLEKFFTETKEFEQGSHMAFQRLVRVEDRRGIIAWLSTLKDRTITSGE